MVTINTEHYIRLLLLNAQGATPVLRETLNNFVKQTSNKTLGDFLLTFQSLFKTLKAKRILSDSEYNKLLQGSAVDINKWDTSLLCLVLLNCCSLQSKLYEFKCILLKEANNDLDTFVRLNKASIDTYKGNGISEEQYNIMFPANGFSTDNELWDMELVTFTLINVCPGQVQKNVLEFKRILQVEIELKTSNLNITDFLEKHEDQLKTIKAQGKLDDSQFEELFPSSGLITDMYKWDTNTLRVVVLNCASSLSQQSVKATKRLRTIRNECLAHRDKAEMENMEYIDKCKDLTDAINTIIVNEKLPIKSKIDEVVKELINGSIDIKSALGILKDNYNKDTPSIIKIMNKLEVVQSKVDTIEDKLITGLQRMDVGFGNTNSNFQDVLKCLNKIERKLPDTEYSHKSEIRCVNMIMVVTSETENGRIKAEDTIRNEIKKAGDNSSEQIKAALLVISEILKTDESTIVEVRKGSIILTIKCISLKGIHRLLQYAVSEDINLHLKQLSSAMADFVGESINISVYLSASTVLNACEDVVRILSKYVDNTVSLRMTLKAETVEELQLMLDEVKGNTFKSQLQDLSKGLSTYIGEDINVDVLVPKIDDHTYTTATNTDTPQKHQEQTKEDMDLMSLNEKPHDVDEIDNCKRETLDNEDLFGNTIVSTTRSFESSQREIERNQNLAPVVSESDSESDSSGDAILRQMFDSYEDSFSEAIFSENEQTKQIEQLEFANENSAKLPTLKLDEMVSNRTENYLRLLLLNAEGATPTLRETLAQFKEQTSNKTMQTFLIVFKKMFEKLKSKRILNQSDYDKLLKGVAVDISEWDTSLLCFVLLNCCTLYGKMYELKSMLIGEAKNDLDAFVLNNKSAIDKYKRKGRISEEQYKIMFPKDKSKTDVQLWDTQLILLIAIKVCSSKVKNTTLDLLKGQIQNEMDLKKSNLNLTDFLDDHSDNLKNLKLKGKLTASQFNEIFPHSGPSDVNKWDSHTLSTVVLYCTSSLGKDTIEAIQTIRAIRNECLAHRKDAEMRSTEYHPQSIKLKDAIDTIITSEQLSIKGKIDSIVDTVLDGPIDMKTTMCVLKDYYIKDSSENLAILENLDKVETHMGNIERKLDGGFQQMNQNNAELLRRFDIIEQKNADFNVL